MTRSFALKASGVALAVITLIVLRFGTTHHATAAPVPKIEMANLDDVTSLDARMLTFPVIQRELGLSADQRVKLIDGLDRTEEQLELDQAAENVARSSEPTKVLPFPKESASE